MYVYSLVPRPHPPKEGKGLGALRAITFTRNGSKCAKTLSLFLGVGSGHETSTYITRTCARACDLHVHTFSACAEINLMSAVNSALLIHVHRIYTFTFVSNTSAQAHLTVSETGLDVNTKFVRNVKK